MGADSWAFGPPMDGAAPAPYVVPQQTVRRREPRGNQRHDVTDRGRRGLRSASGRSSSDQPVALSERLLARSGDDPRDDRPGLAVLSRQFDDLGAARLSAV